MFLCIRGCLCATSTLAAGARHSTVPNHKHPVRCRAVVDRTTIRSRPFLSEFAADLLRECLAVLCFPGEPSSSACHHSFHEGCH